MLIDDAEGSWSNMIRAREDRERSLDETLFEPVPGVRRLPPWTIEWGWKSPPINVVLTFVPRTHSPTEKT